MSIHRQQDNFAQPYVDFKETDEHTTKASPFAAQLKYGLADSVEDITRLKSFSTPCSTLHAFALTMDDPAAAALAEKQPARQDKAEVAVEDKAAAAEREKQVIEVRQLIEELGDDKFATRQQATRKLIELGVKAFPTIVEGVQSKDLEVRTRAESVCKQLIGEDRLSEIDIFPAPGADGAPVFRFSTITPEWRDYYEKETNKRINAVEQNKERNGALQKIKELYDAGTLRLSDDQADALTKELLASQNIDRLRAVFSLHLADYHKDEDPRKAANYIEVALRQEPKFAKDGSVVDLISRTHLAENQDFLKRFESLGGSREELNLACSKFHFEKAKHAGSADPTVAQKHILKAVELNPKVVTWPDAPRVIAQSGLANDERFMEQYRKLGGSLPDLQYECLQVGTEEVNKLIAKNKKAFTEGADKKAALAELKASFEKAISLSERQCKQSDEFLAQSEKRRAEIVDKMPQQDKDALKNPSAIQDVLLALKHPELSNLERQRRVMSAQRQDNVINKFEAAFEFAQAHSQAGDKESARTLLSKGFEALKKELAADVVKVIETDDKVIALIKELGLNADK